jgi:hypothetical protein
VTTNRFVRPFAARFAVAFTPTFTARFAPAFAVARRGHRVSPGHHSYDWHVTATTCGWYGGKSVGRY